MTNRNHARASRTRSESVSPISHKTAASMTPECSRVPAPRRTSFALFLALLALIATAPPSSADHLPPVMHTPQGALDVAGMLPGKYGLLARKAQPIGPGEATVSSVKAIAGLMKQAVDVAAMLPKDKAAQTDGAAGKRAVEPSVPLSPTDVALRVACAVPKMSQKPPVLSASEMKASRALLWPTEGLIYSTFGATRGKRGHGAIDIVAKKGAPIAAAAAGTVVVCANGGKLFTGYGKIVIIDHGKGVHTVYAHCDSLLVKMGQRVEAGAFIGTVGRTGRATTDHCHFEVRVAGKKVDPLHYLPNRPEMVKAHNWRSSPTKKKAN